MEKTNTSIKQQILDSRLWHSAYSMTMCYKLPSMYSVVVACVLIYKYEHTLICMYAHVNVRSTNTYTHTQTYVRMFGHMHAGIFAHWHI